MSELKAALAALAGKSAGTPQSAGTPKPLTPSALGAHSSWFVPPHLLRLPAVRVAAFAAHDASRDACSYPEDFERVYRYGLSLQELAGKLAQQPADQLDLLHQAAEVYCEASRLAGGTHAAALYNWAVALTDIARLVRAQQPDEAYECLTAAANKYAQSLEVHSDNPQANNNWGLVLQDLSSLRPPGERQPYLRHSVHKFRRAFRLRPSFDRACYNLGTVLYSHACSLQEALLASQEQAEATQLAAAAPAAAQRASRTSSPRVAGGSGARAATEGAIQATFAHAAQYIALAYAMQPGKQVYADSQAAVQRLLPLPWLRAGPLLVAHPASAGTPAEQWVSAWFGLDAAGLQVVRPPAGAASAAHSGLPPAPLALSYDLTDVADARLCCDPSLPPGAGLWIGLHSQPRGVYLVAADPDDAEGWVDALLLMAHLRAAGRTAGIKAALAVRR